MEGAPEHRHDHEVATVGLTQSQLGKNSLTKRDMEAQAPSRVVPLGASFMLPANCLKQLKR
jgi:hypothetical protein